MPPPVPQANRCCTRPGCGDACHVIHPAALIDPAAELAADVHVGPCAVIEAGARVGPGCRIEAHAQLVGRVTLAEGVTIGRGAVIGGDPQDLSFDPATDSSVEIGPHCVLREHVTIHRGSKPGAVTRVGAHNFLMVGAHLGHDVQLGDHNVIANQVLFGGHVVMGHRCFVGGGSVFHQFVRVGDFCMVQGLSGFSKDLPPFTMAAGVNHVVGLNIVGLRRNGFSTTDRLQIKRAFDHFYRSGHNFSQALAALDRANTNAGPTPDDPPGDGNTDAASWQPPARAFFEFFRQPTKKGVCAFQSNRD